ncbi:MAG: aminotransferase class III-fold pyridoxal phosphate-dependent enzyme [Anaerotignum sp.]|nr:aminotransferase class III-fold pyridoxal phosphate-dependent enzyme [Anaerotignum sp.]
MGLHTEKCEALVERDKKVIAPCQHLSYYPLAVAKVEEDVVYDEDGNSFIDFLSSASSLNLGSCFPVVKNAAQKQLELYSQYTIAYTYNRASIEYAERLVSIYPGGISAKVCYGNCGSDANDAAVKFARAYTGRTKIITFINAYHGNTFGAASMTTVTTRMRSKMGPFLPEIYSFPFYDASYDDAVCEKECLEDIERAFATYLPADEVAAVIIEPIQGDAGLLAAHPIFMKKLHELCKKHGILFIAEEVQQAFQRTGKWFSIEHYGIVPDGIIMGKSIGAGFVLGGFMARSEIMDCLPAPAHLFTLGGNALACSAGIAAFDYMNSDEFKGILEKNTALMQECLESICAKYPDIATGIRGIGMSRGIIITKKDVQTGEQVPDLDGTYKILYRAYEKGLLVISLAGNILRIQPPLNIKPENLKKGFEMIAESIEDYQKGNIPDEVMQFRSGW